MNTNEQASAIEAARKNELHASHGTMEVSRGGLPRSDGTVDVLCVCGVVLSVKYQADAVPAHVESKSEAKTPVPVRRRIDVRDERKDGE